MVAGVCVAGILGNGTRPILRIGAEAGVGVCVGVGEPGATFDARGGAVGGVRAATTGFRGDGAGVTPGVAAGGATAGVAGTRGGGFAATGTYTGF